METNESIALRQNQGALHCAAKAMLYPVDMQLKDRLKMARKRRKLTLQALGSLLGITSQAVSQWERGQTGPDRNKIPQLAQILRVDAQWLLEGQNALPPLEPDELELFLEQLLEVGKAIPEAQRRPAVQVLKGLIPPEPKQPKTRQRAS